jgi:oxidase EvaA
MLTDKRAALVGMRCVGEWLEDVLVENDFRVHDADLETSEAWAIDSGAIRHVSGRFFRVVGGRWTEGGESRAQPFIEQREVGTLGFLIRAKAGRPELLVQAKVEPGNVGGVMLAPTCQATGSNLARVHGGSVPPGAQQLAEARLVHASLQSEQGTRFLGKRNRNVIAFATEHVELDRTHRWMPVDDVLELLELDYVVNTDARSVLVTSPWHRLVERPFTRRPSAFARELAISYAVFDDSEALRARIDLQRRRSAASETMTVPLDQLVGWSFDRLGLSAANERPFRVRHVQVTALGREVPAWDQPIIDSAGEGLVELACARDAGILRFLFRASTEPGLARRVELGPSRWVPPGIGLPDDGPLPGIVRGECRNSEEGGRFFQDVNRYRVVDIGAAPPPAPDCHWLTLGTVQHLLLEGGYFTNEARSAISLLLPWL